MTICEMCGKSGNLVLIEIDGAELNVCNVCAKYGQVKKKTTFSTNFKKFTSKKEGPELKIKDNFSFLIKSAREKKGLNQETFARWLNERESILHKWENGSLKPRINVAKRLEKVLKIKLVEIDKITDLKAENSKKNKKVNDSFTLGDFIKVRKRK